MSDARYYPYLSERTRRYEQRSRRAVEILSRIPELIVHEARGAFYMTPVFRAGALKEPRSFSLSEEARHILAPHLQNAKPDQRFCYELLAATGICVVPLSSGFNADRYGFRFTLLEQDDARFNRTIETIARSLQSYFGT